MMPKPMPAHVAEMLSRRYVTADLGCGGSKRGDIGIDFAELDGVDVVCQLGFEPIPLPDSSVDKCFAYDFLEHLPKIAHAAVDGRWKDHRPHLMLFNEVFRILKPEGLFETVTPVTEPEANGRALHVSVWNRETFLCFASRGFPAETRRIWAAENRMMQWHGYTAEFELQDYSEIEWIPGKRSHAKVVFKSLKPAP